MVYLSDWKHAIEYKKNLTDLDWIITLRGVETKHYELIKKEVEFHLKDKEISRIFYPIESGIFPETRRKKLVPSLNEEQMLSVNHVINFTEKVKGISEFNVIVNSTYPIVTSDIGDELDLIQEAKKYESLCACNYILSEGVDQDHLDEIYAHC